LDEFRIYDAALSDSAILTSYQAGPDAQQLSVHLTAGNLQLSWPLNGSPITLVGTADLSAGFQPVTYTAVTNGAVVTVNLPTTSAQMFYRLRSP
jgi:hypothetical protein